MRLILVPFIATVGVGTIRASPETRERYASNTDVLYSRLEAVNKGAQSSPREVVNLLQQIENAWRPLPPEDQQFLARRRWYDYRSAATTLANLGDYEQAAQALQKHVAFCVEFGMSPTGGSDSHFAEFVLVQARVASAIGHDPLAGSVDYLFRNQGQEYLVARHELDPEVKGVTVDGVKESETLAQVLEISARDGIAAIDRTRWVVGPRGKVDETLRRATREVFSDEEGRLSAKPLSAPGIVPDAKSREAAPSRLPATPAPMTPAPTATPALSPQPTTPTAQAPAPMVERGAPMWSWLVGIAALAVLALLVWKRRA